MKMDIIRTRFYTLSFLLAALFCLVTSAFAETMSESTDFDGDGLGDLILYNPTDGGFMYRNSSNGRFNWVKLSGSNAGDWPIVGDFNGDSKTDFGTFNRSSATFTVKLSNGSTLIKQIGSIGDVPGVADFTGDGCTQLATFNRSTGQWTVANCLATSTSSSSVGSIGGIPVPDDYDCDGKAELATFSPSDQSWRMKLSSTSSNATYYFGLPGDIPVPAKFSSGCSRIAVYRPSSKFFFYASSVSNNAYAPAAGPIQWGLRGDIQALYNVDGDDKVDQAIFRPADRSIYIKTSLGVVFIIPFSAVNNAISGNAGSRLELNHLAFPLTRQSSFIQGVDGDYNRDGRSDFVTASVDRAANTTTFFINHSSIASSQISVPAAADAFVPGDYNGDGETQPAVAKVDTSTTLIHWYVNGPDGSTSETVWGLNGDQPLAGDLDCDGKDDRIVVRNLLGGRYWYIKGSAGTDYHSQLFGLENDTPFTADVNGDGCEEMIVARTASGGIGWYYKRLLENEYEYVQWGLEGDTLLRPVDVNADGSDDFIVVRNVNGLRTHYQRLSSSLFSTVGFGLASDVPLYGKFLDSGFAEVAAYRRSGTPTFYVRNVFGFAESDAHGSSSHFLIRPDGSAVSSGSSRDNGGGGGSTGCTPTSGTDGDFSDGGGNALWKPVSEGNGKPVFLLPQSPYCNLYKASQLSVSILGSGGTEVAGIERSHCRGTNGNRVHYYVNTTASALSGSAPLTVKISYNGVTECRVVQNPSARYD